MGKIGLSIAMNILSINTAMPGKVIVGLKAEGQQFDLEVDQKFGSQVLLNLIEQILNDANIKKTDLNEIKVATGPGSFTGIRVGVAVANALAFGLEIPVNGKSIETELVYE